MDLLPPPPSPLVEPDPRLESSRIIGGVAATIADRLGLDALWVRLAFVVFGLLSGVGVIVYVGLWLLLAGRAPWIRWVGGGLLIAVVPGYLAWLAEVDFVAGRVALVALLAGLALALWAPRRDPALVPTPPPDAVAAAPSLPAAGGDGRRWAPRRRRDRPPPSPLGRAALGLAVVVASAGALIDHVNGGRLHPEQWLGLGAVVCGVGLVVGAWRGHARWLVIPAVLFAAAGFVAGSAARLGGPLTGVVGDQWMSFGEHTPGSDQRRAVVAGTVNVSIDGAPAAVSTAVAQTAFGDVRILTSSDVPIEVRADVRSGSVMVDGRERPAGTFRIGPEGAPVLTVDARVGRGDVEVTTFTITDEVGPPLTVAPPPGVGALTTLAAGLQLADDGTVVFGGGVAVLDPDGTIVTGFSQFDEYGRQIVDTNAGVFTLLPNRLVLTPSGEVIDLAAARAELTTAVTTTAAATSVTLGSTVGTAGDPGGLTEPTVLSGG